MILLKKKKEKLLTFHANYWEKEKNKTNNQMEDMSSICTALKS